MPYKHFTPDKRNQLAALLRAKVKKKDIAKQLGRDRTTVWQECQRGKYRRRYGTRIREKQREALKKRRIDQRPEIVATRRRIGD